MLGLSIVTVLAQTPPPTNASWQEWVVYMIGGVCSAWVADKAWWHTSRIRSRRKGNEQNPTFDCIDPAVITRLAQQQEKQSEVLMTMSDNQHQHINATRSLDNRLTVLEHRTEQIWEQTIANSKDLEHLKDLHMRSTQ